MPNVRHLELFPFCNPTLYPPSLNVNNNIITFPTGYGSGHNYQFQLPLELCTRMWWTVKTWKVSFGIDYYRDLSQEVGSNAATGSYVKIDKVDLVFFTNADDASFYEPPQDERFLVCGNDQEFGAQFWGWDNTFTAEFRIIDKDDTTKITEGSYPVLSGTFLGFGSFFSQEGFGPLFVRDESKTIDDPYEKDESLWVNFGLQLPFSFSSSLTTTPNVNGLFKIEGLSSGWPNPKNLDAVRNFGVNSGTEGSVTINVEDLVIEAVEYWPYDPEDGGGPIYNTATGQQIRNYG